MTEADNAARRRGSGRLAGVLRLAEEKAQAQDHERFLASVRGGLADADAGRVITDEELGGRLDQVFGPLSAE